MGDVVKNLLNPIRFYLRKEPVYMDGEDNFCNAYTIRFKHLTDKQLTYLQDFYINTVLKEIREEKLKKGSQSFRTQFPSPEELDGYLDRIQKLKASKQLEKKREDEFKQQLEERKKEGVSEEQKQAEEYLAQFPNKKDKVISFYFDMMQLEKQGFAWDLAKKWDGVNQLTSIIKQGKLKEFEDESGS